MTGDATDRQVALAGRSWPKVLDQVSLLLGPPPAIEFKK
jgi:hypothetical protein